MKNDQELKKQCLDECRVIIHNTRIEIDDKVPASSGGVVSRVKMAPFMREAIKKLAFVFGIELNNTEAASVLRQATKGSKKNTVSDLVAVYIHPFLTTDGYKLSVLWTAMILLYDCWAVEAKAGLMKDVNIQDVDIIQSKNRYDDDVSKNYEKRMEIIEEIIFRYVKNYMDRTL